MPRNDLSEFPFYVELEVSGRKRRLRVTPGGDDGKHIIVSIFQKAGPTSCRKGATISVYEQNYPDGAASSKLEIVDETLTARFKSVKVWKQGEGRNV